MNPTAAGSSDDEEQHADADWFIKAMGGGGTRDPRRVAQLAMDAKS